MPEAKRVQTIFLAILDVSTPAERAAVLQRECGSDVALRQRVEELLRAHDMPDGLLDRPAAEPFLPCGAERTDSTGIPGPGERTGLYMPTTPPVNGDSGSPRAGVQLRDPDGETIAEPGSVARLAGTEHLPARYRLEGEIARGGMGCVLRGRDTDLGREVAIKVMLQTHADWAQPVQRFVEEAQIAGQLQHPGITPVYELGAVPGQAPWFSMKLVRGQTLEKLLEKRSEPAQDRPRFLKVFEAVCQALAYAHSRGVIHRDLKPSNIMVGAFGEVQVMDWGLAKVLAPCRPNPSPQPPPLRGEGGQEVPTPPLLSGEGAGGRGWGSDSARTQAGSVLGTPAYMAPEQARGEIDLVDERADVFGLGAILCEILTGQQPFAGKTLEAMRLAQNADLADAFSRLDACAADSELIALARHCLSAQPDDRPPNAGAVATEMSAYLESVEARLRQAELARATEQARAEEAQATAAAATARARAERRARRLTLALGAAVLALVVLGGGGTAWFAQQRAERLARLDGLLREAETALERAARADETAASAEWEKAQLALGQAREAATRTGTVQADRLRALEDLAGRVQATRTLLADLASVRLRMGDHLDPKRTDAEYAAAFRKAGLDLDQTDPVTAGAWLADSSRAVELASYLDDWTFVRRRRMNTPEATWRRLVDTARVADPDPWRNDLRAQLGAKTDTSQALRTLADNEKALAAQPAVSLLLLAQLLRYDGHDRVRAERVLQRAWRRSPDDFWVNTELARLPARADTGSLRDLYPRPEESLRYLSAAVAIRPRSPSAHVNLGNALFALKKHEEAEGAFREAIRLQPDLAVAHLNLGGVLAAQGKHVEAVAAEREAIRCQPDFGVAYNNLGEALQKLRKLDEAEAACREAIRLQPDQGRFYSTVGGVLRDQQKLDAAAAACRTAIRLEPEFAQGHANLGVILAAQKKLDAAVTAFRTAIRLEPDNAEPHANLGAALAEQGKFVEGIAACRESIRLAPNLALGHANLGGALVQQRKPAEAVAACREAIRLQPDNADAHANLGAALHAQGKFKEAVAACREAIRLAPRSAKGHSNLGGVLGSQGKFAAAIVALREAIRLQPDLADAHANLGTTLQRQGKNEGAVVAFREALRLAPSCKGYMALGLALQTLKKPNEAVVAFRAAIRLKPDLFEAHISLGIALRGLGKFDEAVMAQREAVRVKPDSDFAHANLGIALHSQGKLEDALAAFRQAAKLAAPGSITAQASPGMIRQVEQEIALKARLDVVLAEKDKPKSAAEGVALAQLCYTKGLYAAAARLFAGAFAADAKVADDLKNSHRYNAACSAVLAACGKGKDTGKVDDKERERWRLLALVWLRAEQVARGKQLRSMWPGSAATARKSLEFWQKDADLVGVRDKENLARLPEVERAEWQKLWADLDALLKKGARQPK